MKAEKLPSEALSDILVSQGLCTGADNPSFLLLDNLRVQ